MADYGTSSCRFGTSDQVGDCEESIFKESVVRNTPECETLNIDGHCTEKKSTDLESWKDKINSSQKSDSITSPEPDTSGSCSKSVEPLPGSSKDILKDEPSHDHSVWIPTLTIKSEDGDEKAVESDEDEDDKDEEEKEEMSKDESDLEMEERSDGGAYHLAEVSYGEEDGEDSDKKEGTEPETILGMSHDLSASNLSYERILVDSPDYVSCDGKNYDLVQKQLPTKSSQPQNPKRKNIRDHNVFRCDYCYYSSNYSTCLKRHITQKHENEVTNKINPSLCCEICDFKAPNISGMKTHLETHKRDDVFVCDYCMYTSNYFSCLKRHSARHDRKKEKKRDPMYHCDFCDFKNLSPSALRAHLETHKLNNLFVCDYCDFTTVGHAYLKRHYESHISKSKEDLKFTLKIKTPDLSLCYYCSFCKLKFDTREELITHTEIHKRDAMFACDKCSYTTENRSNLTLHCRSHSYKCDYCSFTFSTHDSLHEHISVHTGEALFVCEICGRGFTVKNALTYHMDQHAGISMFSCSSCDFTVKTKRALKNHIQSRIGEQLLFCNQCDKKFCTKSALERHPCEQQHIADDMPKKRKKNPNVYESNLAQLSCESNDRIPAEQTSKLTSQNDPI